MVCGQAQLVALPRPKSQDGPHASPPEPCLAGCVRSLVHECPVLTTNEVAHVPRTARREHPGVAGYAGIRSVVLVTERFAPLGDEIECGFAVEDAGLAALGLDHVQHWLDDLDLVQTALGPDGGVVRVPALAVVVLEIARLAQPHLQVV